MSKWKLLALIAGLWFAADQVTKYLAVEHLTAAFTAAHAKTLPQKISAFVGQKELLERGLAYPTPVQVTGWWQNRYTQNRGAAWGVFASAGEKFRVPFFHLVSIVAVIFIFSYYRKLRNDQRYLQISLALVLGGALGNALDRVLRGYVIDFIDWHWFDPNWLRPNLHWPTFNVADSGISVGLVLLFLEMLFVKKPAAAPAPKKA
ncbi:MAG TPA: signal peptidase II [Myxococcales bacterium]|nr:signal peptidase II [Myxococcales bacterium]